MERFDLCVIGCGTAGSRAAATAHAAGVKVLAVEGGERLGGLCILRGCMPTKTLLETAHRLAEIREASRFGIRNAQGEVDFPAQMERMRGLVERFRAAKVRGIENAGYEVRFGRPRFLGPHRLLLEGREIETEYVLLSAGSVVPPLPVEVEEGARVVDSDAMFQLEAPPPRACVLGAGPVGLEFAQWLARMGTKVHAVNRSPFLRKKDLEMGRELARALSSEMEVIAPSRLLAVRAGKDSTLVDLEIPGEGRRTLEVDLVLNALGRIPNTEGVEGLQALGLEVEGGRIPCGPDLRTKVPHVFVAGDMTGSRLILHDANLEGALVGRNVRRLLDGNEDLETLDPAIPPVEVIFTDPPMASAGLGPVECEARGLEWRTAVKRFPEQGRGIVMGAEYGFLRLNAAPDGRLLGCQILGPRADDLIHVPAAILAYGGNAQDLVTRIPWYHPTLSEAFLDAARELAPQP